MKDFLKNIWNFLRERKKWWLLPIIFLLLAIGALIFLSGGSVIIPFTYALF